MAMSVGGSGEGQSYSDINMTPLIDVMLVLLIIFIITIPSQTHAVKIDNPLPSPNPPTTVPLTYAAVAVPAREASQRSWMYATVTAKTPGVTSPCRNRHAIT